MTVTILKGDCREVLRGLPDESVHCVVTSPPYWGLRDYGVARQIGMEGAFTDYVGVMVEVFGLVRRVLRKDGTCWLNLGDSYLGGGRGGGGEDDKQRTNVGSLAAIPNARIPGLKAKDLAGVPWRVAFALQADGWWLRQDIIWSKPNPMPESVRDRCTKAHEYLFLLSKSERYYYDADAIAEPATYAGKIVTLGEKSLSVGQANGANVAKSGNALVSSVTVADTRNRRSVWEVTTQPFPDAHFATFPPALIEPCILAGCPVCCCSTCAAPWNRLVEKVGTGRVYERGNCASDSRAIGLPQRSGGGSGALSVATTFLGWEPSCNCGSPAVGGTVLDPFAGAGTTGLVADRLKRNAILIELNPEYAAMAERRIKSDAGMFADVSA